MSQFRILDSNYLFDDTVSLTASTSDTNFPVTNLRHPFRSKVWRTTSTTSQTLVIDLKTTEEIDSFVMIFDPMAGCKMSPSATVKLQANATNTWASPAVDQTVTLDTVYDAYSHFFSSSQSYRFWRIAMTDVGTGYGYLEVSKIILTKATQLTQNPEIGFLWETQDRAKVATTPYGHRYSDLYPIQRRFEFNYSALSASDLASLEEIYLRLGSTTPLVVALDSDASLFDKDRFLIYGFLDGQLKSKQNFLTYFDMPFSIVEAL